MIHSESSKRKFEEELAMDEVFSFSDMLNANVTSGTVAKKPRSGRESISSISAPQKRRQEQEPVTENMDPEVTVRGRMHWVGVMKDWDWETTPTSFSSLSIDLS
ncbi:hypothetical protein M7I_7871 [Glarea lozoyensis 74030]|uniref:Uncharacterized protein n=1 Tax=Glarea lozoyensis (strain ATCC 74030 / MF5533) TaxID=1104152 RepID=H0EYG9_GLAL7|nr:hypothetical protein M7I_7871 [Glarea lozoyensis 74030]